MRRIDASRSVKLIPVTVASAALAVAGFAIPDAAYAVDGCKLLLCLAGNWKSIPMCVPTVQEALHDAARGHPFPTCDTAGSGNTASHQWANQANCPSFYSTYNRNGWSACSYAGVISVRVNDAPWADVFWRGSGATSTRYYDAARTQLGSGLDPTYDADAAAAAVPAPPSSGYGDR